MLLSFLSVFELHVADAALPRCQVLVNVSSVVRHTILKKLVKGYQNTQKEEGGKGGGKMIGEGGTNIIF